MPELDWKKSGQDKALEFTGGNMLVSASAGSGKTTVMVEKIKRYIEAGGSLKRLVVVTFTRASAADMKEKIELELKELVRRTGDKRYKDELRALPISYIGTVDSLCQNIYRNYFEDAGGAPVFKVLEEDESAALLREASDEVLEEALADGDAEFEEFLARYAPVSAADGFFETVAGLFSYLDTRSDPEEFFERARSVAKSDFDLNPAVKYLRERTEAKFRSFLEDADYFVSVAKGAPRARVKGLIDSVAGLAAGMRRALKCPSLKDFYEAIADIPATRRPAAHQSYSGEELECFKRTADFISYGNEAIREAKTLFSDYETDKANESAAMTDAERVLASVERVAAKYAELKKKEEAFDYSDIERAALRILSDGGRAEEFASGIDYIFFDEYQDVNPLQEAIITLIQRDNLFMVGDVKQSIYRFRHSEPKLFLKRYREYGAGRGGTSVPLNMNFRSSQPILDFADRIFSKIMTPAFGGIDYDGTARFNRAGSDVATEGFDPVKAVFFEPPEEPVIDLPEVYSMDAAPLPLPARDLEARSVAEDIHPQQLIGQAQPLQDALGGGARAHSVGNAGLQVLLQIAGDARHLVRLPGEAALLHGLELLRAIGHPHHSIQSGGHPAGAIGVLVQVHHLPGATGEVPGPHQGSGDLSRRLRVQGKHRRLDLHPRRDPQHRDRLAHCLTEVAGGAVAPREEDQLRSGGNHGPGRPLGVSGAGVLLHRVVHHAVGEVHLFAQGLSHSAGGGQDLQLRPERHQRSERPGRLVSGFRVGAPGPGGRQNIGAVRPLQGHLAAHARDGVDDQTQLTHRGAVSYRSARSPPARCSP